MQRRSARVLHGLGAGESASVWPGRTAGPRAGRTSRNLLRGRGWDAGIAPRPPGAPETRRLRSPAVAEAAGVGARGGPGRRRRRRRGGARVRASARLRAAGGRASVRGRKGGRGAERARRPGPGPPSLPASALPPARAHRLPAAADAPARAGAARELARRRPLCASPRRWERPFPARELFKRRECAVFPTSVEERGKDPAALPQTR